MGASATAPSNTPVTSAEARLTERFPTHMNPSDAVLWDIEKDPVLRSTITAIAMLDQAPDWDRLVARMDYASRVIPRLRQRVVVPPLRLGPPRWVIDPDFDLSYHLRRTRSPAPGTLRQVLDLAQPMASAAFDRARPLWEFTLVEGLDGGGAALIQKIHHTLTDGVGAIELALTILDEHRQADDPPIPAAPSPGALDPRATMIDAITTQAAAIAAALVGMPRMAAGALLAAARNPFGSAGQTARLAGSVVKIVAPVPETASSLMIRRSLQRRFDTLDVPLAGLKAAGHASGGTANDAFLAAVVEGMRRYHERHGAPVDELRVTMPISLRHEGDELGGNHFAPARFAVPTTITEPLERMRRLGALARAWQAEPALEYTDAIALALDRMPVTVTTGVFGGMLKHVDAVVTNVPGIPSASYLAGAEVIREYAFAPPTGAAINVALLSHVETACIGLVSDVAAVPDPAELLDCLREGFDDVLAAGAGPGRAEG